MKRILSILALGAFQPFLWADTMTFDFADPKGVNNVLFLLDAPLEQISGSASGISGTVVGHPDNPADVTGKIVVQTSSLNVANPVMREHMLGKDWLNAEENPEITFELVSVANVTKDGDRGTADVTGKFTLNGVTKEITVPVSAHFLAGRLRDRGGDVDGDLLVLRSNFTIKRSDFNIKPGELEDKVSDEIQITLSVAGVHPHSK
jgi:polyisoprenoid-binding protein YceI